MVFMFQGKIQEWGGEKLNFFSHALNFFTDLGEEEKAGPHWMETDPSGSLSVLP